MTKREFDRETKENYGRGGEGFPAGNWGAPGGSRTYYRRDARLHSTGIDYVAHRAAVIAHLRRGRGYWEPELAALGHGSPFRAPQAWRASVGKELLSRGHN